MIEKCECDFPERDQIELPWCQENILSVREQAVKFTCSINAQFANNTSDVMKFSLEWGNDNASTSLILTSDCYLIRWNHNFDLTSVDIYSRYVSKMITL